MTSIFILAALGLLVWFWVSTLQAREQAIIVARRTCERYEVQF